MADTSKVVFPWERERQRGKPKKLKRLDEETINKILNRHGIDTGKTES